MLITPNLIIWAWVRMFQNHLWLEPIKAETITLYNPVKAGLASDWRNWAGAWNGYDGFNDF
jgi:hypothetical protein